MLYVEYACLASVTHIPCSALSRLQACRAVSFVLFTDIVVLMQPFKPSNDFLIGNQPYRGQRIFTVSK